MGIERVNLSRGAVDLAPANIRRGVDDLALQIGQRDNVVIDHAERSDTGGGEIHQRWRAETAGADHQHGGFLQGGLAGASDFTQHDVAGGTLAFGGAQPGHVLSPARRASWRGTPRLAALTTTIRNSP